MDKGTVIITGASSGIGLAIGKELENCGYHIINISRHPSPFENMTYDLSDASQLDAVLCDLLAMFDEEKIEFLINNAGVMPIKTDSLELFEEVISTNLRPAYALSCALAPIISGGIINISSVSAKKCASKGDSVAYGISKSGLCTLTNYLAFKYPELCVNTILPGFISPTNLVPGETPQELINTIPMGYEGNVNDIATLVSYLAVEGRYITGQEIAVDGGLSL